jgi:hypothetical protein
LSKKGQKASKGKAEDNQEETICHLRDYFSHQMIDNGFARYDILIRYLFVKEYYAVGCPNKLVFPPYEKLIKTRGRMAKSSKFVDLIRSFERKGYDPKYPIMMSRGYINSGGTHRIAICLYKKIHEIPIIFNDHYKDKWRDFSAERLVDYGLEKYIEILIKTKLKIFKQLGIE